MSNLKPNPETKEIEMVEQKVTNTEENTTVRRPDTFYSQNGASELFNHLDNVTLKIKPQDTYANAIPIGSISYGMNMVILGLYLCNAYELNSLVVTELLLVGGIAQITAGIFEFIKGRSYVTSVYFTYGFYCLTHMSVIAILKYGWVKLSTETKVYESLAAYYFFWMLISISMIICSFKSNLFFTIKTVGITIMYFLLIFGYGCPSEGARKAGGAFGIISGVAGIYIGAGQMVNEGFNKALFPMFPYVSNNGIDIFGENKNVSVQSGAESSRTLK